MIIDVITSLYNSIGLTIPANLIPFNIGLNVSLKDAIALSLVLGFIFLLIAIFTWIKSLIN